MEDPHRPVTGYPAPNPNPNGYPPTTTAYPYYPPPNPQRATCLRRILAFTITLILLFAVTTFIVWLVLRPQLPKFSVTNFTISNFTLTNTSLLSFTSEATLLATNPNKKMTLAYDRIEAVIFYKSESLAETSVPPFGQGTRNETELRAGFVSDRSYVDGNVVRVGNGNAEFNLRMICRVKFRAKAWRTRNRFLKVFCGGLVVGLPTGSLSGGPRQCRVGI